MRGKRPMHVLRIARRLAEPGIEILDESRCIGIGRRDRVDAAQPQFLDQTILQGLIGAFHTAFGLRGVGADDVDVELIKSPPELCQAARPVFLRGMGRTKNTVFVAVKCQRLGSSAAWTTLRRRSLIF